MLAMFFHPNAPARRSLAWSMAVSALVHALVLLFPDQQPVVESPPPRLQARLAPRNEVPSAEIKVQPEAKAAPRPAKTPPKQPKILTTQSPSRVAVAPERQWSAAEKTDMNRFLEELDKAPRPTLAQRSMAMAREQAQEMARQDEAGAASLELRPNAAPPDPFSLSMYVEGLLKRLNRSAAFVRNDPRSKGVKTASVQFRINPDGSLKSFEVLNEADQAAEIAFIRSVVERSIPFAPFPADIDKSARSLTMTICIRPAGSGGGFGFSRASGRHC
ncbi:MAG: hypothetical protein KA538_08895 [Azonexus sp.]|jgi:hypothetical protein|nr:hypothetical protein [Azonexus sp.]